MGTPTEAGILEPELRHQPGDTAILGLAADESGPAIPFDLASALRDVSRAKVTAREYGVPVPTTEMLKDTAVLLQHLYEEYPYRYDVYPSGTGGMVIYARPELGRSIMVVRHANGGAWCSVCVPGINEAIGFDSEDYVSAETLRKALRVMNGLEEA